MKAMESEILKYVCANQGAVDAEDLMFNLFPGESTNEVISNQKKFVLYPPHGKQKVVARTSLRLCRTKGCSGSCSGLHLCKKLLLHGVCQNIHMRPGCHLPHKLSSDHNQRVLKEHELDCLSREELCTLLLQNDNTLLPSICHDYNNGVGESGKCLKGFDCERLHICEKYLKQNCICPRTHDFFAFQPLKRLHDKEVPVDFIRSLRFIYTNKEVLRLSAKEGAQGHGGNCSSAANNADAKSDDGQTVEQKQFYRGRGRGGNRGQRGNRGGRGNGGRPPQQQQTSCFSDPFGNIDGLFLYHLNKGDNQHQHCNSFNNDVSAAASDIDAKSDSGLSSGQREWYRGRGGNRGQRGNRGGKGNGGRPPQQQRTTSLNDIFGSVDGVDLFSENWLTEGSSQQRDLQSSNSDVSAAGNDSNTSANSGQKKRRARHRNQSSGVRGRGGKQGSIGGDGSNEQRQKPVKDKTEICMFFIKGFCKNEDRCVRAHDKMPYRWQVQEGDRWNALPSNEAIEKDYCDPKNSYSSGSPPVHFDTMTRGPNAVRRLSTVNSLVKPDFIHTTEWLWYWQDEFGKWNPYGSNSGGHKSADISSAKLEQKYLDNDKDVVEFTAGSQSYSLSFQDMIQTNRHYGTKRLVSRRPLFVSGAEVKTKKVNKTNSTPVPDYWDKTQIPQTGFTRVALQATSDEYKKVQALFCSTQRGFDIIKIERIQNKALWEVFQWQKNRMKDNNGGIDVTEKQLFHGTDSKHVDAICLDNFDWRICGTHGTAFGKGSYFARDASYSHSYTGKTDIRTMFVSRVLVGSYTKGAPEYVRPPSKDSGDINFYDSCVNDVTNPSIFVVFEKHQIYPEYQLQYKSTVTVQKPKPILKPAPAATGAASVSLKPQIPSYQQVSSLHQSSTSAYPSSTSSYGSSTSAYGSSTSAYGSSTSPYGSSTSAYGSSTSAYGSSTSAYGSSTSPYGSSTSAYGSSTSAYGSSTSAYGSSTSAYGSSTSAYGSSTSAYGSSTSAYPPSTSSYPSSKPSVSSLPPKAQSKKSDSCVIS